VGFDDAEMIREEVRGKLQESLVERRAEVLRERREAEETWLDTVARESPDAREGNEDDTGNGDGAERKDT
jgi:hypothetical protein